MFPRAASLDAWFQAAHGGRPTPIQALAWPALAHGGHALLVAPTGTGKTLAGFLPVLDRLLCQSPRDDGLQCVYISPLRSLCADVERALNSVLAAIAAADIGVGMRTGDTTQYQRRKLWNRPPAILVTTPESLALLLSQPAWNDRWRAVAHVIVDEIHELVPTKRGADLTISLERLAARAHRDPQRIGLSATCRPIEAVARFLGGTGREVSTLEAPPQGCPDALDLRVQSLLAADESAFRPLAYSRLLRALRREIEGHTTTVVFANTRALTEKLSHDLTHGRNTSAPKPITAPHHSALDARRRRDVEQQLKSQELASVITSTSLELGVDIGSADLTLMVGPPPSVTRCLQRVGRSGHRVGGRRKGLIFAATEPELLASIAVIEAAREGAIEPIAPLCAPLDVLSQQLLGMACADTIQADQTFDLIRRAAPFAHLSRADFEACLAFLSGGPDPDRCDAEQPRWTSPRLWNNGDLFAARHQRVRRWLWSNIGTIHSEETISVMQGPHRIGTVESAYADRLQTGDRIVLDGRALRVVTRETAALRVEPVAGVPHVPKWTSDRLGLSGPLALRVARLREQLGQTCGEEGPDSLRQLLRTRHRLDAASSARLAAIFEAQLRYSELPAAGGVLIEQSQTDSGRCCAFHAPLGRAGCEALARATAARMGRIVGMNLEISIADLGWTLTLPDPNPIDSRMLTRLLGPENLESDVLEGLDRGELLKRQFERVAATSLMVLRNPEAGRTRVGGLKWVGDRLYPWLRAQCPDHPMLRETRRTALRDVLDTPAAESFLRTNPRISVRVADGLSPFAAAWLAPGAAELVAFESPSEALARLHQRLCRA